MTTAMAARAGHLHSFVLRPLTLVLTAAGCLVASVFWPLALRFFVVEAFQVPTASMLPTLVVGDHIYVRKLLTQPRRGDVAVFRYPIDTEFDYLKRIVAVAGDTIEQRRGQLFLNGVAVKTVETDEPCPAPSRESCRMRIEEQPHPYKVMLDSPDTAWQDYGPISVPPGHFFVMGDNRNNSNDSRVWGFVPDGLYVGRASFVWWSRGPEGVRWDRMFMAVR